MCATTTLRPALGSDRLILRGPTLADAPQVAELANDPGVAGMTAALPLPYALSDAEAFLSQATAGAKPDTIDFAVEHRDFGLIGMLGFAPGDGGRPEVGYWLGRRFWGRGYATEALSAALRWASGDWRRKAVWAGHFADNAASGQVLNKAGFLYTGDIKLRPSRARGRPAPTRMMVWLA